VSGGSLNAVLTETITSPDALRELSWMHDAVFDVDEIEFDEETRTLALIFDQDVHQFPRDLGLPDPVTWRRGWFKRQTLVPLVECRTVIHHVRAWTLDGEMDWGMLNIASFAAGTVRLQADIGPSLVAEVDELCVVVVVTDHVRFYQPTRYFGPVEYTGERIAAADVERAE
jgi:hypothetical protein